MTTEEAERTLHKMQAMLVFAIATGTTLTFTNHFIKPATVQDLAKLEKATKGWVRATCRHIFKLKPREIPDFYLDLQNATWTDDGDNTVTVHLDFGKLFPGERPPELLEMAQKMMARYDDQTAEGGNDDAHADR